MDERKKNPKRRKWIRYPLAAVIALALVCAAVNVIVVMRSSSRILELEFSDGDIASGLPEDKADCILILGAGLWSGYPSPMLRERLDLGAALYNAGASDRILVSGDNGSDDYNEPQAMEDYLADTKGVPREAILKDPAGFSTYDSMFRAKEVFGVGSAIIVTQRYHLFRAVYIASKLGIAASGADAHRTSYSGRYFREARECLARVKDFFMCILKPEPEYSGEKIPVN